MGEIFGNVFSSFFGSIFGILQLIFEALLFGVVSFLLIFFVLCGVNPFRLNAKQLRRIDPIFKYFDLFRWLLVDFLERDKHRGEFQEYGFTFFVGRQGAGKTISMVHYLDRMKNYYPDCMVVTNFDYWQSDHLMTDWRDLLNMRNGTDGIIFAIDEIHSEYDSSKWNDIPEDLLSEISQQRKQRVKIIASAQFFTRVAKPLREQAMTVVSCNTFLGRLTFNREYPDCLYEAFQRPGSKVITVDELELAEQLYQLRRTEYDDEYRQMLRENRAVDRELRRRQKVRRKRRRGRPRKG